MQVKVFVREQVKLGRADWKVVFSEKGQPDELSAWGQAQTLEEARRIGWERGEKALQESCTFGWEQVTEEPPVPEPVDPEPEG